MHRLAVLVAALACAALLAPASALADVALSDVVVRPIADGATCAPSTPAPAADAPAGGHRDLCVAFNVDDKTTGDDLEDITIHLAPGLLGDPNGAVKCTKQQFEADACPPASQVGTVSNTAVVSLTVPQTVNLTGQVFNLAPQGQEPARLGIKVDGTTIPGILASDTIHLVTTIAVRTTDYGLDTATRDVPRKADITLLPVLPGLPGTRTSADIQITQMTLTLWGRTGVPGRTMPKPFIVLPTSCAPATNGIGATAYDGKGASATDKFTPTACDKQPYAPTFAAALGTPGQTRAGDHVQVDTLITQKAGEANTAKTVVTLPSGFGANAEALKRACPEAQLFAGTCPATSKVGRVEANSPVLPFPMNGDVYIVQPKGGILPELSLELPLGIRLRATVGFAQGGRLQTIFPVIPDVPIDRLRVILDGGPDGMLVAAKDMCRVAPPSVDAEFTSHGGAVRTVTTQATIPCTPGLSASARVTGVRKRKPALSLTAAASGTLLRRITVTLPRRLRPSALRTLRAKGGVVADGRRGAKSVLRVSGGRLVVTLPADGARTVKVTLRAGALRQRGKLKPGKRLAFKVDGVPVSGDPLRATARAKARR